MRRTVFTLAALATITLATVASVAVPMAASAAPTDTRHCYTLGAPGQPHYEYCTYLPVDPNDIIR